METKKPEGKRNMKMKEVVVEEEEEEEEEEGEGEEEEEDEDDDIIVEEENKKKIRALLTPCGVRKVTTSTGSGGSTQQQPSCQVDDCEANLKEAKPYHRRHKVCELHSKAPTVIIAGIRKRFCQQCSRFHDVSEFDEAKRSCRRRLAGHNERRRKTSYDSHGDG